MNYDRALDRISRLAILASAAGSIAAFISFGWKGAIGFLAGAALSIASLRSFRNLSAALGGSTVPPRRGSAMFLAFRYLLVAAITYVIVKYLEGSLLVVLAGLLVVVAAVIVEILYELIFIH